MKKRGIILLVLMAVISVSGFSQNAGKMIKAGEKFMSGMKYEAAYEQFTKAIDIAPDLPDGYVARAGALEKMGRYTEAKADLEKAVVFAPKSFKVLYQLGKVDNHLGKYDEAIVHLNRATAIDKRNKDVYPEKVLSLLGLEKYDQALRASDTALLLRSDARNLYYRGLVYINLNNYILGKKELEKAIAKDKNDPLPRLKLVEVLIREGLIGEALGQCNTLIQRDDRNTAAYTARSRVYVASMDYPNAINDISRNIVIEPNEPEHYFVRGQYYQQFSQHPNAINDFSKYISLKNDNPEVYFARAKSYEEIMNFERAAVDYEKITVLSEFDQKARMHLKEANERLFEINRETVPPEIVVLDPVPAENTINVRADNNTLQLSGRLADKSIIASLKVNGREVPIPENTSGVYNFITSIDVSGISNLSIEAKDVYDNIRTLNYDLRRTEVNPPRITVSAPLASPEGIIFLDNNNPTQRIVGRITDESMIKSISIEGTSAAFSKNTLNPQFEVSVPVLNKDKITIIAEDIYGNINESDFSLNREGAMLAESNPMGRTWVVFIENSDYTSYASLDGPEKDIVLMRRALENYDIHAYIHKKNLTKQEMERFFSIELRDQIRENNVKSLMIWYAGHGKNINETGYWIPVDATRDDEFTYFNINGLRASMESYINVLTHILVITDACESGPSFYTAMRAVTETPSCTDWTKTQSKSSQVLSSAGTELAVDNSQFTQTFYNTLVGNQNACLPIETVVQKVTEAVSAANQQKPKFGDITGLRNEGGTFFFISK
jgi:tetratricopeptide (TPR) repeat protein